MHDLNFQLKAIANRNRDGSAATQKNRERILSMSADQLFEAGFKQMTVHSLGGRHITALLERWARDGVSNATIKNRMSCLRWWAEKVGRESVIPRTNSVLGIQDRSFVTNVSKAKTLPANQLAEVKNEHANFSLRLQQAFGLRREEAIKIIVAKADQGDRLDLQASWTKGGRARSIPIRNDAQRRLLDEVRQFAGNGSLIPAHLQYVQQLKIYERQCIDAGLNKMHGLRHAYAQERYLEMIGWLAPAVGGPTAKQLTPGEKLQDRKARLIISKELGHEREQITAVYLGR
jgi:site-specific recombinase XerC